MASKLQASSVARTLILLTLAVVLTVYAVDKAGQVDLTWVTEMAERARVERKPPRPISSIPLVDHLKLSGVYEQDDLYLSDNEVNRINNSLTRHMDMFPKVNLQLNPADELFLGDVELDTELKVGVHLKLYDDREVERMPKAVPRRSLAPHMEKLMNEAAQVYDFYRRHPEVRDFRKNLL